MKNIYLILLMVILTVSCKKQTTAPSTPSTTSTTTTTTVTPVDTTGKDKIYFVLALSTPYDTTKTDYVQTLANCRIYHNDTLVGPTYNENRIIQGIDRGVIQRTNFNYGVPNPSQVDNPVWMAHGDSIVVEFDSLEYNGVANLQSFNFKHNWITFFDKNKALIGKKFIIDYSITINDTSTDRYLGMSTSDQSTTIKYDWYLHKKFRYVWIYP